MKPADHPEFFRFPAPEGRSRESSIRLTRRGQFFHDGEVVENARMTGAFFRWMTRHPDNGRFILSNGYDWTYLEVEGTPLFVRAVRFEAPEGVRLVLSDGTEAPLVRSGVRLDEEGALNAIVRDSLEARFLPSAQTELGDFLEEVEGFLGVVSGGVFVPLSSTEGAQPLKADAKRAVLVEP